MDGHNKIYNRDSFFTVGDAIAHLNWQLDSLSQYAATGHVSSQIIAAARAHLLDERSKYEQFPPDMSEEQALAAYHATMQGYNKLLSSAGE